MVNSSAEAKKMLYNPGISYGGIKKENARKLWENIEE